VDQAATGACSRPTGRLQAFLRGNGLDFLSHCALLRLFPYHGSKI